MGMLETALIYRRRYKWAVIPIHTVRNGVCTCGEAHCATPGKHLCVPWLEYQAELPSVGEVKFWFGDEYKGCNIGVVTGKVSGIVVLS